jgi:hypothetical protein
MNGTYLLLSYLSIDNKLLIYKTVIKPIWTYGIELGGCARKTNIAIIQRTQSKTLRSITNEPWCTFNLTSQRSKSSLRYRNYQRKQHQALQQTRKPLQPTSSTTTTTAQKSQTQKKLASRLKELRKTSLDVYPFTSRRVYN